MSQKATIFPYMLLRVAGDSFEHFKALESKKVSQVLIELHTAYETHKMMREGLSDGLHAFINTVPDKNTRNLFIEIRRHMYNSRSLTYLTADDLNLIPSPLKEKLLQAKELIEKISELTTQGEKAFEQEVKQAKATFVKLLENPNFQNGLILSSSSLPASARKYQELQTSDKQFPKIERSLMKYLSRMYTKPSPFSSFTQLAAAEFAPIPGNELFSPTDHYTQTSKIKLNHQLYHYLFGLLVQNKAIRGHLPIKRNTTIRIENNQFTFITNNFNRESFQRITTTQALEAINSYFEKQAQWNYTELITELIEKIFPNTPRAELEAYIDQLLAYGFLEYDLGISGNDHDWDHKLLVLIKPLSKTLPYLANLMQTLKALRELEENYADTPLAQKELLLKKTFIQFRASCLELHQAAGLPKEELASFQDGFEKKKKEASGKEKDSVFKHKYFTEFTYKSSKLLYEDTSFSETVSLNTNLQKELSIFSELLNRMEVFDSCAEDMYAMAAFFKKTYGQAPSVDLLIFYEAYTRHTKEQEKETKKAHDPAVKKRQKQNEKLLQQFLTHIDNQLDNHDEINIPQGAIAHIPVPESSDRIISFGALFQTYAASSAKRKLVFNSALQGYGKLFSRFLPLLSDQITTTLREWNKPKTEQILFAEPTDSSTFNADLHPSIMPYEITMPGGYNNLPKERQIDITDIHIIFSQDKLWLQDKKTKKSLFTFDLGFQGPGGRSELYTFLSKFVPCDHHNPNALTRKINDSLKKTKGDKEILVQPRISYADTIILQRKTWITKAPHLPKRNPQENDWQYLLKIDTWRRSLKMPDEVFVTLGEEKPQYISFTIPLLPLFEKLIERTTEKKELKIVEMLPATNDLDQIGGNETVTEFFAQWYRK